MDEWEQLAVDKLAILVTGGHDTNADMDAEIHRLETILIEGEYNAIIQTSTR